MASVWRECELYVVRVMPHVLREDCMTVGVVVMEQPDQGVSGGGCQVSGSLAEGGSDTFADFRITRDWKRLECFAPDLELEIFEHLEATVREALKDIKIKNLQPQGTEGATGETQRQLAAVLEAKFGDLFEVSGGKGLVTRDPVAEMEILERDYLAPMALDHGRGRARHAGRMGMVARMQDAFEAAGVLKLLQRDVEMTEFTGENDPFKVDFGFRVGKTLKMFHALALNTSREPAVTLAYRYGRIREGMRARGDEALLTAVIHGHQLSAISGQESSGDADRGIVAKQEWHSRAQVESGVAMLREGGIRVRPVGEMAEIAEEVRREAGG